MAAPGSSTLLLSSGVCLAAAGLLGRLAARHAKTLETLAKRQLDAWERARFYRGGFEPRMSRREAGLILGVSPSSGASRIGEKHKRIMLANHPDRGGSQYMASKINEAKDVLLRRTLR